MADTLLDSPARRAARPAEEAGPPDVYAEVQERVADGRVWIDLLNPSPDELQHAGLACGLRLPTREDLSEIESSSRHYVEKGALYLSAPLLTGVDTGEPRLTPVGFIVTRERLITVRFDNLKSFDHAQELARSSPPASGLEAFTLVYEAVIDRIADVLELLGSHLEELSHDIFNAPEGTRRDSREMRRLLRRVGGFGDRGSKLRGTLLVSNRILPFVVDTADGSLPKELERRLKAANDDVASLTAYQENLANKVQFLLDASLGLINIEQNDVFKILTVVSAVGVPPTLVASIYGMNFKHMPELEWAWGYPYAWGLIVLTTVLPIWWFKRKGWF